MPKIEIATLIDAPIEICFDLARDAAFHVETARETGEMIVEGKSSGHFELGDEVVFEGRHFGVKQRFGAKITALQRPHYFVDEMTRGAFQSMQHRHEFLDRPDGKTRMLDIVEWKSPLGILGKTADFLILKSHLTKFITLRGQRIKERAESQTSTL
ncbi:cell division protein [bacterium]|nr:MAG: cell division protein [bacterium]